MVQKTDLLTGEKFVAKRSDQKFATPKNRIRYNNLKLVALRKKKSEFDQPLHENFRILSALMEGKKSAVFHREYLKGKGFHFFAMTHYTNYEGKSHKAVYQFIVVDIGIDQIKIVKHE